MAKKHIIHSVIPRDYGSVCNLSMCAEQCVMPAAFYVFTVCISYIYIQLDWLGLLPLKCVCIQQEQNV